MSRLVTARVPLSVDSLTDLANAGFVKKGGLYILQGLINKLYFCASGTTLTEVGSVTPKIAQYDSLLTAGYGVPVILAIKTVTARATNFAAITYRAGTAASVLPIGLYKIETTCYCATAGNGTVTITVGWTDDTGARTLDIVSALDLNSLTALANSSILVYSRGVVDITIAANITVSSGAPAFSVRSVCSRLTDS